ncbi:MAG: ABC transporter [Candidatus Rokuibacteriota bacterium]|nr:MAG: ABC transporter [Candidatus Rokubacteria bacterium]
MATRASTRSLAALAWRFRRHLGPVWRPALGVAGLVVASPLLGVILLWTVKAVVDQVLVEGRSSLLPVLCGASLAAAGLKFGIDYLRRRLDASTTERIVQGVRTDLYDHLLHLSLGSLGGHSPGDLLAHLSGDVERVERLAYGEPVAFVADASTAVAFGALLFVLSSKLALLALVVVPLLAAVVLTRGPIVKRAARVAHRQAAAWLSVAEETLGALPVVHAFGTHGVETARFAERCRAARWAEVRAVKLQALLTLLVELAATLGGLVVLAVSAYEIRSGALTLGTVVAFLGSLGSLYEPIRGLGQLASRVQRAAAGASRVAALLETPSGVSDRPFATELTRVHGSVEFRRVSFAYSRGPMALDELSLTIKPGEMVAVVGPSGSGKSTLVRLLLRLYDPLDGGVLVDGIDIRDVTLASLRRQMAVVFQESFILRGSIAGNIRYGQGEASGRGVVTAAQAAGAHRFIASFVGGYRTQVGSRGERLSGGQRQRLALSRAFLREAPILILDEATASIDSETEAVVQESVERLAGRRTILVIGHRLSTVRRADRVLVLERGRVVEEGPPDRLLHAGSRCHELFLAQPAMAEKPA